jgi:hypothetical protein
MAASTCWRVVSTTLGCPVETRDTVCDETPASRATSAIETPRPGRRMRPAVIVTQLLLDEPETQ